MGRGEKTVFQFHFHVNCLRAELRGGVGFEHIKQCILREKDQTMLFSAVLDISTVCRMVHVLTILYPYIFCHCLDQTKQGSCLLKYY